MDCIIPFASSLDLSCQAAIETLELPQLQKFLNQAEILEIDHGSEYDFIPPHERILGLSDQVILTPCHWIVGIDGIVMCNPKDLQMTSTEAQALLTSLRPYFLESGIRVNFHSELQWLVSASMMQGFAFASLDRVIGRSVDIWQIKDHSSRTLRRLINEIQMLLYIHPVNEAREAKGLPSINSFWLSYAPLASNCIDYSLRDSALENNWLTWQSAWQDIDAKIHQYSRITLCGERHAKTYQQPLRPNWLKRAQSWLSTDDSAQQRLRSILLDL